MKLSDLLNVGEPIGDENIRQQFRLIAEHMINVIGSSPNYKVTNNILYNAKLVMTLGKIPHNDFVWLCNRVGKMHQYATSRDLAMRTPRICAGVHQSINYRMQVALHPMGTDIKVTNPYTGNSYWIGYNS